MHAWNSLLRCSKKATGVAHKPLVEVARDFVVVLISVFCQRGVSNGKRLYIGDAGPTGVPSVSRHLCLRPSERGFFVSRAPPSRPRALDFHLLAVILRAGGRCRLAVAVRAAVLSQRRSKRRKR